MNTISPLPYALTVLALDPSTDVTGAVAVAFSEGCPPRLILADAFDATRAGELGVHARRAGIEGSICRIRWTRQRLSQFVRAVPAFDTLAFEGHTGRGLSSGPLDMALGAYLSLSAFGGVVPKLITRLSACVATGTWDVYSQPAGKTNAEKEAKKARLKGAILGWALDTYPAFADEARFPADARFGEKMEAVADALAVAESAWVCALGAETIRRAKVAQGKMTLRVGGKPCA